MTLSNVVRIDVKEALMRPDLSTISDRKTFWYAHAPRALADGTVVPARGQWTLAAARTLAPAGAGDALVRGLLGMYAREREGFRRAAPHDPNFTAPLEVTWHRLTREEADPRPFARTHCLALAVDGTLAPGPATFAVESVDVPDVPVAPAAPAAPLPPPPPLVTHDGATPLIRTLHAFGAKQASEHQVTRALIEHPSWLAPMPMFLRDPSPGQGGAVLYGAETRTPKGALWVFSDRGRADHANAQLVAQGGQLGPYLDGVPGVALFSRLDQVTFAKLNVNIGSPVADTFFFGPSDEVGGLLALWARAIGLEQRLAAGPHDDPALLRDLHDFPGLCVFQSDKAGLFSYEQDGQRGVVLCTSIDCAEAFAAALPAAARAEFPRVTASGAAVLKAVTRIGVQAIFVNPAGPGRRSTVPVAIAAAVAALG